MIISKVTKNLGFTPSLEDTFLEKPQGGGRGYRLKPGHHPRPEGLDCLKIKKFNEEI